MDLITQGLLGSTVAQAACSEKVGRRASLYGFLIGLMPDFDIVTGLLGPWASLKYHRGPTHSFIILALAAWPIGWLCKKLSGSEASTGCWAGIAFLSLITHPVIDWFTTYGTCLLWPVSDRRFALDALSIIDPAFSLPLFLVTFAGLSGLFSLRRMRFAAIIALILTTLYAGWGYFNSQSMAEKGKRIFQENGFKPVEVRATPTLLNIFVFRVVAIDGANNFMVTYLRTGSDKPVSETHHIISARDPYVEKALADNRGRLFQWFSMNMLHAESHPQPDGTHSVILNDMRYGMLLAPDKSLFSAEATFDSQGNLTNLVRRQSHRNVDFRTELKTTIANAKAGLISFFTSDQEK